MALLSLAGPILTKRYMQRNITPRFRKYLHELPSRFDYLQKLGLGCKIVNATVGYHPVYFAKVSPCSLSMSDSQEVIPGLTYLTYRKRFYTSLKDLAAIPFDSVAGQICAVMGNDYVQEIIPILCKYKAIFNTSTGIPANTLVQSHHSNMNVYEGHGC